MRKPWWCVILIIFVYFQVPAESMPSIPSSGTILDDFIPKGWILNKKDEGDLNKDGLPDIAAAIEEKLPPDTEESARRILLLLLKNDSGYILSAKSAKAILRADDGGMMGDPFLTLACSRGSVLIGFYGGSRSRWGYLLRFRLQDEGWALIGLSTDDIDAQTGDEKTEDFNLLTGQVVTSTKKGDNPAKVKKNNRGKRKLILLKDFNVSEIESLDY